MTEKNHLVRHNYEVACNQYVSCLCNLWDIDKEQGFWIGNEIGGVYFVNDFVTLNMDDLRYVVDNAISCEECVDWLEYNIKALDYNFDTINLKSWHNGAPRVLQSTFDQLDSLRLEFEKAIKHYGKEEKTKKESHF